MRVSSTLLSLAFIFGAQMIDAAPVTGWVLLFDGDNDATIAAGTEATAGPQVSDAHRTSPAANFPAVTLSDGDSITLTGTVSFSVTLSDGQFRFGLFNGDNPVTEDGGGQGYVGLFAEAPIPGGTADVNSANGGSTSHPFENAGSTALGSMSNPGDTPSANTALDFTLTLTRNGGAVDIEATVTDGGSYTSTASLVGQTAVPTNFTYDRVAFLTGGGFAEPMTATYSNIDVSINRDSNPNDPESNSGERLLGIDFNRNDALSSPSQSLFRVISGSQTQSANAPSYVKTVGAHQVTVSEPGGSNLEFRGGNTDSTRAIPGGDTSLSFLVADFVGTRKRAINISISNLPTGIYSFRSWHLEPSTGTSLGFAQGSTTTTPNLIEARHGGVVKDTVEPTALGSSGLNTTVINDGQIPAIEFSVDHDGTSPLTIELRSTRPATGDSFLFVNGFELLQANP